MKFSVLIFLAGACASAAFAQTPLRYQAVVKADPCAAIDSGDLGSCGMESLGDGNYASALKAWMLASRHGDYQSARWLGEMYANGKGVKRNYLEAYGWFDIAAALHARALAKEGPAPEGSARDSNQDEIEHRNAAAKKLNATQIRQAQQFSHNWQQANPHAVDEQSIVESGL